MSCEVNAPAIFFAFSI